MNPLVAEFLGVALRWVLSSLGGYLVARHIFTADQNDRFTHAIIEHALLYAPMVGALLLGLWSRYRGRIKFLTALEAPEWSTEHDVKQIIKEGNGASVSVK